MTTTAQQRDSDSTSNSRTVRIERDGRFIRVEPPSLVALAGLTTCRRVAGDDPRHGYRLERRVESLLDRNPPGPNAGLEPVVWRLLHRAGYRIKRNMIGPVNRLPQPDLTNIPSGYCDRQWLDFVHRHFEGVGWYQPGQVDIAHLVAEVCLAYPSATIAIVGASKAKLKPLARWLRKKLKAKVSFADAAKCPAHVGRIVVSTFMGLADPNIEFEKRDIVIVPNARDAISERGQATLSIVDGRFRLFGLLPINYQLAPRERDLIAAIFGLEEVTIYKHGYTQRSVTVTWSQIIGGQQLGCSLDGVALKHAGLWAHELRNRRIAKLAKMVAAGEIEQLRESFSAVAQGVEALESRKTLILVESVDHALALAARFPQWPLVTGPEVTLDGLDCRQRRLLAERRGIWSTGNVLLIATTTGLSSVDVAAVDVIIWAGGGAHPPPLPPDHVMCRSSEENTLLVIDFDDHHHPVLQQWAQSRREAYDKAGWFAVGVDPLLARVDRFLAQRMRRRR